MIKALDRWLLPWISQRFRRPKTHVSDVMLAVCDHFEPLHRTDKTGAMRRLAVWKERLPSLTDSSSDHEGTGAKHTFFYPIEQYDPDILDSLSEICRRTRNEVEVHLHHDNDTAANLARTLEQGKTDLRRHGLLGSDPQGSAVFGFIHGNWALDDSDPSGCGCGVRGELAILKQAGCYADFTMPSAPHRTQAPIVNQLYYARSTSEGKSHHRGRRVSSGHEGTGALRLSSEHLLIVQGPLSLDWRRRKWGILPRIENSDLGPKNPPTSARMAQWLDCRICVSGAESWCFIKLHTHGAPEFGHRSNLGEERREFYAAIEQMARDRGFRLHYVSAREMVNILHAAEDGHGGDAGPWRDYIYNAPPLLRPALVP
jgi:hypothetical protein